MAVLLWLAIPKDICGCSPSPPAPATSPVVGVVIAVDSSGLGRVSGFSLRVADGRTIELRLGALENASAFSPSHVTEHMATSEPVRAYFRREGAVLVVYRLEDASTEAPAT